MTKNLIQESRMRNYFIDATKNIIRGEGVRSLSVRNVAEQAGYSYATIYNYFTHLDELIIYAAMDFLKECGDFINNEKHPVLKGKARIISLTKAYMKYFVQYPSIYELLFIEKPNSCLKGDSLIGSVEAFYNELLIEEWEYFAKHKDISSEQLETLKDVNKSMIHGYMLFNMSRKSGFNYKEFIDNIDKNIESILLPYDK